MTAPDDVRARFERDYLARYPNADLSMLGKDDFGHYRIEQVAQQWRGYRAAHADLSGEVRELVEAASQGVIDGTGRLYFESGHKADNFRRALAALAKHTHQGKP